MLIELENFREDQYGRAGVLRQVDLLERTTRKALLELRTVLIELRRQDLGEEDVVKLIKQALLERQERTRNVKFGLHVAPQWPERIPAGAAMELFRMVTEAVDNAIHHSAAQTIEVVLALADMNASVSITDDGRGLPRESESTHPAGLGILGMNERAALLGGRMDIVSGPNGRGTRVLLTVPQAVLTRPDV